MNKNGKGITEPIEIMQNARQGTIYGPKLCSTVTERMNEISRKNVILMRNIIIESLIFDDYICSP